VGRLEIEKIPPQELEIANFDSLLGDLNGAMLNLTTSDLIGTWDITLGNSKDRHIVRIYSTDICDMVRESIKVGEVETVKEYMFITTDLISIFKSGYHILVDGKGKGKTLAEASLDKDGVCHLENSYLLEESLKRLKELRHIIAPQARAQARATA
jgi:hypothetical protein